MDWLITDVDLLRADGSFHGSRDVLIREDRILAIDSHPVLASNRVERVIEGRGKLMIPGLINAHLHSHDRFDKGRLDNLPLEIWMAAYNCPLGSRDWTAEDCYLRTALNCLEQIRCGVTTVIDDVVHGDLASPEKIDAVFQAYEDAGLRARVTIAWADLPYYDTIPFLAGLLPENLKREISAKMVASGYVLDLWQNFAERYHGRVSFGISPFAPQRCSDDFMKSAWNLAEKLNLPVFLHTLETKTQQITGYLRYGIGLVEHMDRLGLLTPRTNLIHSVWLNDREIDRIAETGARVIHNPVSNLKLGSGIAPISRLMAAGVPVGIGTDNNNCNDSANLLEAMKTAALIGKVTTGRYEKWVGAKEAMAMATRGGAACYDSSEIGDLKPGSKADFALFNLRSLNFFPDHNRLYQLVYAENGQSLETVVVDGRVVMENGKVISLDESKIMDRLSARQESILRVIAKSSERAEELLPYLRRVYDLCLNLAGLSSLEKPAVLANPV